jgi:serine/tyrosine/threonine adenylyltransferase
MTYGPSEGYDDEMLPKLYDYVIKHHYQKFWNSFQAQNISKEQMYQQVFEELTDRTAKLVAMWQGVGFCHGVLNTDNMSILGITIDYGPFGFMNHYRPGHICNLSDRESRYSYKNQPDV